LALAEISVFMAKSRADLSSALPHPTLTMKIPLRAIAILLGTAALGLLALSSCASYSDDTPATTDFFDDPDTKRLKLQEQMSKMTREASDF
jgi:hypothetical protein